MSRPITSSPVAGTQRLFPPKASRVLDTDVGAVIGALTLVVVGLWIQSPFSVWK